MMDGEEELLSRSLSPGKDPKQPQRGLPCKSEVDLGRQFEMQQMRKKMAVTFWWGLEVPGSL